MAISKIEVKNGKLNIEFTPLNKEKTSIQFESKSNKLMVDTMPNGIDIVHKTVDGQSVFVISARPSLQKEGQEKGDQQGQDGADRADRKDKKE